MKKEVKLRNNVEPLQISYPSDYARAKSGASDDEEFFISSTPKLLTPGEIELVNLTLSKLPYRQYLDGTGCVMGVSEALQGFTSNAELDLYEKDHNLPSTSFAPAGGRRSFRERQLLITENLSK